MSMKVAKILYFKQPILYLKGLNEGKIGAIDTQNAVRVIDGSTYEVLDGFKTNLLHERHYSNCMDMTPDGELTVATIPDSSEAAIFSLSKRALVYKVSRHHGEIESVGIDPNGRYFVTCGQDGKVFAWVLKTSRFAFALPTHSDYVSVVAFSDNGQWIATGSHDHTINLLNIAMMNQPLKLRGHGSPIVKIIFLPDAKLLSVERDGGLILWDIAGGKVIKRLSKMNDDVTSMCISQSKRFVFVTTKLGYVGLYDMETMEQITHRYLKESESITSIVFLNNPIRLAIGTLEGNIRIYSLLGDEQYHLAMLNDGIYKPFYDALDENPMLYYSKAHELAEKIWNDTVEKGEKYLEKNERQKAKEIFKPFESIAKKNALISQIFHSYEKYEQFEHSIKEGRLPIAYSLAKQFPVFQTTELYRTMEIKWKKLFFKAQELILSPNGEEKARDLLSPYRGISEKTLLIQQLFEDRKMYIYFKKTLSQHDYVKFFTLIKKYPFLKEFPEYTQVMEYSEKLYMQAKRAYGKGEYSTVRKACEILISFPEYTAEAQEMDNTIRIKHLFYDAIASNNLSNAFTYLSAYPLLYETPEAQKLERQWNDAVDKAQRFAAKANPRDTLGVFEPYFGIKPKYTAMAAVVAQAYCAQLEQKIRHGEPLATVESGIRQYVAIFGADEGIIGIVELLKKVSQSTIDLSVLRKGSFESWTPSIKIDDITRRV
jgi:hypothetical protein